MALLDLVLRKPKSPPEPAAEAVAETEHRVQIEPVANYRYRVFYCGKLLLVSRELQVGRSRKEALRGFADRTGLDEVRALVAQLIQSERLGSSIGGALRAQADSLRTARRLEAEEQANKTQIKLLFPLILFIFPSVMIVILMPAVLRLIDALKTLA